MFFGRTNPEAEVSIFWPPDAKTQLIRKGSNAGKNWGQEEKGMAEDGMIGCHHWLNGYEFEQTPEIVKDREAWCALVFGIAKSQTWYSDWGTTKWCEREWGAGESKSRWDNKTHSRMLNYHLRALLHVLNTVNLPIKR